MAYTQKHVKFEDEEYPSNDEFCPDKSFIEAWENYLADEDLEEEMEAFRCARGRFMDLVVQGPLAAVTITLGKTPDSAVMTTRAGK
jgi:hypothetical protein